MQVSPFASRQDMCDYGRTRVPIAERIPTPQRPIRIRVRSGKELFWRHETQAGVEREFWPAVGGEKLVSAHATERTNERALSLRSVSAWSVRRPAASPT